MPELTPELAEAMRAKARQCPPLDQATKARLEGLYMRMDAEARQAALDAATAKHLAAHEAVRDTGTPAGTPNRDTQRGAA